MITKSHIIRGYGVVIGSFNTRVGKRTGYESAR